MQQTWGVVYWSSRSVNHSVGIMMIKMIQQRLMLSSDYHTHAVKNKKGNFNVPD